MSEQQPRATLWTDFDGTVVEALNVKNPAHWYRNMLKTGLRGIPEYRAFLDGVQAAGVEIGGVISRRPEVAQRRRTTIRSVAYVGLTDYFSSEQIMLKGSEEAKGRFLVSESHKGPVGFVEDKPHKLIPVIASALVETTSHTQPASRIVIGVVEHARNLQRTERSIDILSQLRGRGEVRIEEVERGNYLIQGESFSVETTLLPAYSESAGQDFGLRIAA